MQAVTARMPAADDLFHANHRDVGLLCQDAGSLHPNKAGANQHDVGFLLAKSSKRYVIQSVEAEMRMFHGKPREREYPFQFCCCRTLRAR
jgi:hypothetical protein